MIDNTINDDVTMAEESAKTLLADRYRIVRQLGQGGMGSVWLAEDTQLDGKLFAIKMLPSILVANKRAYNQLKSEALVAMKLVHPNIVQIRAFEENNGNPFLVMDYIDGETLDDWLGDRGQELGCRSQELGVSEEEVVKLLKPIAEALDYAHTEGVVHRDVKPANVMIRKDGRPFIMDFGIAREIQETLTRVTGKLSSGTLLYMSPEQLNGDMPKKEQDVYSFAAMVYECLKGEPPFCRGAIEDQIKNKTPEALGDDITIASSVMAGLAKAPEERPKSCVEVLEKKFNRVERVDRVESGSSSIRRHLLSPSQGGRGVHAAPQIEEISSRALQSNESPSEIGKRGVWKLLAAIVFLGFVVVYLGMQCRNDFSPPMPPQPPLPPEKPISPTEVDVADIMVEAAVKKNQLQRIDDADGFERRKIILSDLLTKATSYGKAKQWDKAACNFTNYVDGCNKLITLDSDRKIVKEIQSAALASQRQAEKVEASKYASVRWGAASDVMKNASEHFSQMEFSEAKGFYESAANQFKLCISEAKNERERQVLEALATNPGKVLKKDLFTPKLKKYEWIYTEILRVQGELSALFLTFTEGHPEVRAKRMKLNELLEQFVKLMEKDGLGDKARKALKSWAGSEGVIEKPSSDEPSYFIYEVRSGDSLAGIAIKHQTTVTEIYKLNKIRANFKLWVGQKLKIPINKSVSNKSVSKVQLWEGGPYWAKKNIGAEKPEDYGYYFWWGDTVGYKREGDKWVASDGSASNFEFRESNTPTYKKSVSDLRSEGWITAEGILAPEHDAAHKHWGGNWRMPTKMEFDDLLNKCDWIWTHVNGVNGYLVRGKGEYSSKSIFLPCAGHGIGTSFNFAGSYGYGCYYSSVPSSDGYGAWYLYFSSGGHGADYGRYDYRSFGWPVRPLQGFTK